MEMALWALTVVAAYLVGGIPFGYLVGRWRGIDIFQHGSGNIGATNVGRVLGRKYGVLVFVLDFAKGATAVAAAFAIRDLAERETAALLWQVHTQAACGYGLPVWAGLAAFLGHLFPIYLRFRGGKGVATGAGVVTVLMPVPALGALLAWLGVAIASRYVSLASLTAVLALCLFHFSLSREPLAGDNIFTSIFCLVAAALVFARHRSNLIRLLKGNENQLPETAGMMKLAKTVHVLSLGLWFGSAVFFILIVTGSLFGTFESLGEKVSERPGWLPLPSDFSRRDDHVDGPKEQGSRAAGAAVTPLFAWFFVLQGACGLLAAASALSWSRKMPNPASRSSPPNRVHRLRSTLLLTALALVLIGWPVQRKVSALRGPRNQAIDNYLKSSPTSQETALAEMKAAKTEFASWHLVSLGLGLTTLALVTLAMALAAQLPTDRQAGSLPYEPPPKIQ